VFPPREVRIQPGERRELDIAVRQNRWASSGLGPDATVSGTCSKQTRVKTPRRMTRDSPFAAARARWV